MPNNYTLSVKSPYREANKTMSPVIKAIEHWEWSMPATEYPFPNHK
jgi:hypothetical protein